MAEQSERATGRSERLAERYVAHLVEHEPVATTRIGRSDRDGDLPDLSTEGIAARARSLAALAADVDRALADLPVDARGDDREARGDLELLRDELAFRRFVVEVRPSVERDPLHALGQVALGIDALLRHRPFGPEPLAEARRRAAAAVARARRVPGFLERAGSLLTGVPEPHLGVALARAAGLVGLVRDALPRRAAELGLEVDAARDAGEYAAEGIEAFAALVTELAGQADVDWRLGPEHHAVTLRAALGTPMVPQQIEDRARTHLAEVRERMDELAGAGWARRFPGERLPDGVDERIRRSLDAIADAAVPAERLLAETALAVDETRAFVEERGLVELPAVERLTLEEVPPWMSGTAVAYLAPAPPLDPSVGATFHLAPVPRSLDDDGRRSFLREYNPAQLRCLAMHEANPGHFVQLEHALRHPRLARRLVSRPVFAEGWAVHAERVMVEAGFATDGRSAVHADDVALTQLKLELRIATNALLDVGLHAGSLTDTEALQLLTGFAFQERAEAEGKLQRAKVTSGQLTSYFVGGEEFADLRRLTERAEGGRFDLAGFHRRVLAHGTPTVAIVAAALADDRADAAVAGATTAARAAG
jgi:uncharacterized protein (DUF885 family)